MFLLCRQLRKHTILIALKFIKEIKIMQIAVQVSAILFSSNFGNNLICQKKIRAWLCSLLIKAHYVNDLTEFISNFQRTNENQKFIELLRVVDNANVIIFNDQLHRSMNLF